MNYSESLDHSEWFYIYIYSLSGCMMMNANLRERERVSWESLYVAIICYHYVWLWFTLIISKFHIDNFSWNNDPIDNGYHVLARVRKVRETWSALRLDACGKGDLQNWMFPWIQGFFLHTVYWCILYNVMPPLIPQWRLKTLMFREEDTTHTQ